MPRLELAITNIVEVFSEYANSDCKLKKQDLKKMMENEIQNPELKAKICATDFGKAVGGAGKSCDGEIDFKEFMNCLTCMAKCHYNKKTGKCPESGK